MNKLATLVAVALVISTAAAQPMTLTTTFVSNNGQSGNMFDIVATNCVVIDTFDANLDAGTWDMEIYTISGTFVGNELNAGAWTLVGSATGVVSAAADAPTAVPININITMAPGQVRGFYVTVTNGLAINYTNGTVPGAVFASDANIQFLEGSGNVYPFGAVFSPRVWNGNINYTLITPCSGPWDTNDSSSSLDVDGVMGAVGAAAIVSGCVGQTFNLNSANAVGGGHYDIAFHFASVIPAPPGIVTPGGQRVNLNLADPTIQTFNGGPGLTLTFLPHPGAFSIPVSSASPFLAGAQQAVTDVGHPDGIQLSQPCELNIVAAGSLTLSLGDDATVQVFLASVPLCGSSISFYGTSYTDFHVNSNGDVSCTQGSTDFSATSNEWATQMPRIGMAADLEPNNFGTITVNISGAGANGTWTTISYANVTEWGTSGMGVTSFDVVLHGPNGHEIANFATDGTWGATAVVCGISNGALGPPTPNLRSFDADFGLGVIASLGGPTDNIMEENAAGMIGTTSGWTSVGFPFEDGSAHTVN